MAAPRKPCAQVHSEFQPKLTTKSGMASGMTTSTAQTRRPGRSVRSTHHAAPVPITAQATVTTAVSRTVFQSRDQVSERKIRPFSSPAPAPPASISRKTSGTAMSAATAVAAVSSATGRDVRRPVAVRVASWTSASRVTAGRPGGAGRWPRTRRRAGRS